MSDAERDTERERRGKKYKGELRKHQLKGQKQRRWRSYRKEI
jgi:hypothetical protein